MHYFTFHYVSIKTKLPVRIRSGSNALHSIMYLLKLLDSIQKSCPMFRFTFHYVSIKTLAGHILASTAQNSLHSIMYLLKPIPLHYAHFSTFSSHFCRPHDFITFSKNFLTISTFTPHIDCIFPFVYPPCFMHYLRSTIKTFILA